MPDQSANDILNIYRTQNAKKYGTGFVIDIFINMYSEKQKAAMSLTCKISAYVRTFPSNTYEDMHHLKEQL